MQLKNNWLLAMAIVASSAALATAQERKDPARVDAKPAGQKETPRPADQRPAAPGQGSPRETRPDARPGDQRLDNSLDELSTRIQQRHVEAADYERVRAALRERPLPDDTVDPRAKARAARIELALDSFDERMKRQKLTAAHVDMIREQLVDERLDRAVERWRNAAAAGKVGEEEYRAVSQQLAHRAEVARSFDPNADAMRLQLQGRLDELQRRAKSAPLGAEDVAAFRADLLDQRLDHAIANLERRAADDDLTRAELARLRGVLEDHAVDAKDDAAFSSMQQRLNNALDALDQRVASGKVDPADVGKLRAMLVKHARAADASTEPKSRPDN